MKFDICFTWKSLESESGQQYSFPDLPSKYLKRRYAGPGVYRWAIFDSLGKLQACYIGEAEDLARRLHHYVRPGKSQQTNLRLNAFLHQAQTNGLDVQFQLIMFGDFVINSCGFGSGKLSDPFARKVVENLAILESFTLNCDVLNKGMNVVQKQVERVAQQILHLAPENRSRLVQQLLAKSADQVQTGTVMKL